MGKNKSGASLEDKLKELAKLESDDECWSIWYFPEIKAWECINVMAKRGFRVFGKDYFRARTAMAVVNKALVHQKKLNKEKVQ